MEQKPQVKKKLIIVCAVLGVILMLFPYLFYPKEKEEEKTKKATENEVYYSEILEKKLTELVEAAEGTGRAKVMISLESTAESVWAKNATDSNSAKSEEHVKVNDGEGEELVLVTEIYPRVRGVAIVCDGGGNSAVKKRITDIVAAALGISANKIAVSG